MRATAFYTSCVVVAIILWYGSFLTSISFARSSSSYSGELKSISGGTLDVKLESSPYPAKSGQETVYEVTFLHKGRDVVLKHVDYEFAIVKNSTMAFKASQQSGQLSYLLHSINNTSFPLLHTAEGIVTIPLKLEEPGSYTIRVSVMGINFIPMATENADFSVNIR